MFLTGPKVVKTVTGEDVTQEQLGGATMHTTKSGVAQFAVETEEEGIQLIRQLLSYMPQNNMEDAPMVVCTDQINRLEDSLNEIIPDNAEQALRYGRGHPCHRRQRRIPGVGCRLRKEHHHLLRPFQRPVRSASSPTSPSSWPACSTSTPAARPPVSCASAMPSTFRSVTLVDVPGFLPGTTQEYGGVITHGAKLLFAYCEATVPKITVTLRKAYGGAYIVMSSKHIRGDINYAWPTAEIAVMGASGAVEVLYAKELAAVRERRGEGQVRGREGAGVQRQVLQSLQRRPLRLYRRRDRAAQHAFPHHPRSAVARNQAFAESGEEAFEYSPLYNRTYDNMISNDWGLVGDAAGRSHASGSAW